MSWRGPKLARERLERECMYSVPVWGQLGCVWLPGVGEATLVHVCMHDMALKPHNHDLFPSEMRSLIRVGSMVAIGPCN